MGNRKYESLKSQNVSVLPYNSKDEIEQHLHKAGCFNVIVCDKVAYHVLKEFAKKSPRCILLVDDNADLYEDELLFYRYPLYSIYYGSNGVEYLKKVLPRSFNSNNEQVKMLYHLANDRDLSLQYGDYEKVEFKHNL